VALALAIAPLATAEGPDSAAARAAFDEAERLYQLGRFEEAIASYEKAYALDRHSAFLYNIALAHRRQFEIDSKPEHLRRARELYRNYLRLEPTTPRKAAIEQTIQELGIRLDKEPAPPTSSPPRLTARPEPPPPALVTSAPPQPTHRSHTAWWIAGGAAVAAATVLVVVLARGKARPVDGPAVNLGGMPP
jgi:tetratricopeptide (TPR) repeat protein